MPTRPAPRKAEARKTDGRKLTDEQFIAIAKALADPRRMALLEAISDKRECPCQYLRREFPVSKATLSHHLKELVRAGLVDARREGQFLHCEIRSDTLETYSKDLMRRVGKG